MGMPGYQEPSLLIGGAWRRSETHADIINPGDESVIGTVPHATAADLDEAVAAAERGFQTWRATSPAKRAQIMAKAAQLMRERVEALAVTMTLEQGKPIDQSRLEVLRGADIIEWDAQEGRRVYGRVVPSEPGLRNVVLRQPIGVVAAFAPWNFPVTTPARKIGGALAAGCSIILKASEETPGSAALVARAFMDAGLPDGVLNLLFGRPAEIAEHLIAHPSIRLVTFTGSIAVGKRLAALAGQHMKPAIMELGGHAPVIVCDDADPVAAAAKSALGKARNSGQVCTAPTRFFVADAIYDRFVTAFGESARKVRMGDGLDPTVQMGPLANARQLATIESLVEDAVAKGARVMSGGRRADNRGYFYPLTVLADVPDDARAMQEEPFGPLALVARTGSLGEAVERANAVPHGLAAYAFTHSARNIDTLSETLRCGNLAINHFVASTAEVPFGGVGESGYGREGGTEGLQEYTVAKLVSTLVS